MTPAEITAKPTLIPAGYLAKSVSFPPGYLGTGTPTHLADIYSLSSCVNDDFADYVERVQAAAAIAGNVLSTV